MNRVIVVAGPTASGKTALGIELANRHNGEIVSADSMQIYKGMDIGTAKATAQEQAAARHHMIDIVSPDTEYSVSMYVDDAVKCCEDIISRGKLPIIVGGTGLYIDSLLSGRTFGDRCSDDSLRNELNSKYDSVGGEEMLSQLSAFDPQRAQKLYPNDKKRIVRAFEVYLLSGKTITEHDEQTKCIPPRYDAQYHILGLDKRDELYARIDRRVDQMMEMGLIDEVKTLLSSTPRNATSMQAIGYKEIVSALDGLITVDEAIEQIKQSSRRYAKRQITWFKKYAD